MEARLLRQGPWESRAICSRTLVKWLVLSMPAMAILAAIELLHAGAIEAARVLLLAGIGLGFLFTTPFLPVYTPARSRFVRYLKC